VAAVEALLFEGINVNITLLFAVDRYEEVARAYMSALERRQAAHAPLADVASVASFFLSRIDTAVDEQLHQKVKSGLPQAERVLGRCAIANARLAYRRFRDLVSSERWRSLETAGARPQRLLWASTSTKNPSYDDLMYVEPLVGPHTINTMPRKTSAAFAEHGKAAATLEQGLAEADDVMRELATLGIDLSHVTRRLLDEGIEKFIESYEDILQTIVAKSAGPTTGTRSTSDKSRRPSA
jgi:transaldolase